MVGEPEASLTRRSNSHVDESSLSSATKTKARNRRFLCLLFCTHVDDQPAGKNARAPRIAITGSFEGDDYIRPGTCRGSINWPDIRCGNNGAGILSIDQRKSGTIRLRTHRE